MKKPDTYKVNHPTIKSISIRDQFVLENGEIITFVRYEEHEKSYPFVMKIEIDFGIEYRTYNIDLRFYSIDKFHHYDIKRKLISLKEKLDLI